MPAKVDEIHDAIIGDPNFKPQAGKTKENSAWAVAWSRYKGITKNNSPALEQLNSLIEKARPGLVLRPVTVHPKNAMPYKAKRWVRIAEEPKDFLDVFNLPALALQEQILREVKENIEFHASDIQDLEFGMHILQSELNDMVRLGAPDDMIKQFQKEIVAIQERLGAEIPKIMDLRKKYQNLQKVKQTMKTPEKPVSDKESESQELELMTAPITTTKNLGGGINQSFIITFDNETKAVFKPHAGESHGLRRDISNPQYKNEVAAYQVAKIIGLTDLFPTTVIREDKGQIGSAQRFIEAADMMYSWNVRNQEYLNRMNQIPIETLQNCAFFNALIGNEDRHGGNALWKNGQVFLIDHGLAFPNKTTSSDFKSIFINANIRRNGDLLRDDHRELLTHILGSQRKYETILKPLLPQKAIQGIFGRVNEMIRTGKYSMLATWRANG